MARLCHRTAIYITRRDVSNLYPRTCVLLEIDVRWHDRCYRFGQTKPVEVYRLVMGRSLENKMHNKQARYRLVSIVYVFSVCVSAFRSVLLKCCVHCVWRPWTLVVCSCATVLELHRHSLAASILLKPFVTKRRFSRRAATDNQTRFGWKGGGREKSGTQTHTGGSDC